MYIYLKKESEVGSLESRVENNNGTHYLEGRTLQDYKSSTHFTFSGDLEALKKGTKLLPEFFLKATQIAFPTYSNHREKGIYFYGKAKAELTYSSTKPGALCLSIETNSWNGLEDMEVIQEKIYAGTISPSISYEREQKEQSVFDVLKGVLYGRKLSPVKRFILSWRLMLQQ